jgi:hypothetical protein
MNFLRIWGGGIYVQDGFFDCADEMGILLEQDGIYSNGVYQTDPAFLSLIAKETRYQARRLASHPSLFMWSGRYAKCCSVASPPPPPNPPPNPQPSTQPPTPPPTPSPHLPPSSHWFV